MNDKIDDKFKFQYSGLKFLYEMELLDDPQVINNIKFNIFRSSKYIKDTELLISQNQKAILIWVELSWFSRKFRFEDIQSSIILILNNLLPKYKFRVVHDKDILNKSIENVKNSNASI